MKLALCATARRVPTRRTPFPTGTSRSATQLQSTRRAGVLCRLNQYARASFHGHRSVGTTPRASARDSGSHRQACCPPGEVSATHDAFEIPGSAAPLAQRLSSDGILPLNADRRELRQTLNNPHRRLPCARRVRRSRLMQCRCPKCLDSPWRTTSHRHVSETRPGDRRRYDAYQSSARRSGSRLLVSALLEQGFGGGLARYAA
jgi:hypothetical protein